MNEKNTKYKVRQMVGEEEKKIQGRSTNNAWKNAKASLPIKLHIQNV